MQATKLALAGAVLIALTACGQKEDAAAPAAAPAPAPAPVAAATSTTPTLDAIRARDSIACGVNI